MRGQSLVEVLVAMTVGVLVLTAMMSTVLSALVTTQSSKMENLANQYAQEGMEIARISRNAAAGIYCLDKGKSRLEGIPEGTGDSFTCPQPNIIDGNLQFKRTVRLYGNETGNHCVTGTEKNINQIVVSVQWKDSKCTDNSYCHEAKLDSCTSVIVAAGTITPIPPTPTPMITNATLTDDTYADENDPNDTNGNSSLLYSSGRPSYRRVTYLKFDLTAIDPKRRVVKATLKVHVRSSGGAEDPVYVKNVDTNVWDEDSLTWINKPPSSNIAAQFVPISLTTVDVDVTGSIQSRLGQMISFSIEPVYGDDRDRTVQYRTDPPTLLVVETVP